MLSLRIWNFFTGYLLIRVEGLSLEKFINLCIIRGIHLWGIKRPTYTTLTAYISIKGFKQIHPVIRAVHCRLKITDKRGLPFLLYKYKKRKMLILGMVVFLILLYGFSSFVWIVEVEGTLRIDPDLVIQKLSENGLKPGKFKGGLDLSSIENRIIIEMPELSWISIELRGTKVIAHVVETVKAPKMIDRESPCNIVALRDGIIERIIVLEGEPLVEPGDTVRKGELLVSGIIDRQDNTEIRYVHAMAEVIARTWYEGKGYVSVKELMYKRTGRIATSMYLEYNDLSINLKEEKKAFEHYELVEKEIPFMGKGFFLPIMVRIVEYHEVVKLPAEELSMLAREKAETAALKDVEKRLPSGAKIIDKKFKYDMIKDIGITAIVYVETLEDIAEQRIIPKN